MNSNAVHNESKLLVGVIKVLPRAATSIFQHKDGAELLQKRQSQSLVRGQQ